MFQLMFRTEKEGWTEDSILRGSQPSGGLYSGMNAPLHHNSLLGNRSSYGLSPNGPVMNSSSGECWQVNSVEYLSCTNIRIKLLQW